ncbi:MAG: alpha-L-rhamnosidase-related protein [Limisphaerales bacterium]
MRENVLSRTIGVLLGLLVVFGCDHVFSAQTTTNTFKQCEVRYFDFPAVSVTNTAPGSWFVDFGQDAFGYLSVRAGGGFAGSNVVVRFGEMRKGNSIETKPPGLVRYGTNTFTLQSDKAIYDIHPPHTGGAVNPPTNFGSVMPFRYVELRNFPGIFTTADIVQHRLAADFDTNAARFESSSAALNSIWNLCRNSMQWLTFDGVYIDGDRERKPYEADAYIQQLSTYAVQNDFKMPRCSFEYLVAHPTWPTEWSFHMVFIAWADYMQTGNKDLLVKYYDVLKKKCLLDHARADGLIRGNGKNDVIDWPPADRDGYDMKLEYKAVVNAFYYRCMVIMEQVARATGHKKDAADFKHRAANVYKSFDKVLWNETSQNYIDGEGSAHPSAHANFFPLAFGLVPQEKRATVLKFLHDRTEANGGMVPSVYGAQYLLEALFENDDTDMALGLITTNSSRSWLNMMNAGSTLTTEAWSFEDKANQDWNHAWGSAPGNLTTRYVLGVRPLKPGFSEVIIQPRLGTTLQFVKGTVPTIRGAIELSVQIHDGDMDLSLQIPATITATVMLPTTNKAIILDGKTVSGSRSNQWLVLKNVSAGSHEIRARLN